MRPFIMKSIINYCFITLYQLKMEGLSQAASCDSLTAEKQQALLINIYKKSLGLLYRRETVLEGQQQLLSLLNQYGHLLVEMKELKVSVLLSLAEIYWQQDKILECLRYCYESLQIDENFNTWLKIMKGLERLLLQSRNYQTSTTEWQPSENDILAQLQIAYKHCIKLSPDIWRDSLIERLLQFYHANNRKQEYNDLQNLIKNGATKSCLEVKITPTIYKFSDKQIHVHRNDGATFNNNPGPVLLSLSKIGLGTQWTYLLLFSYVTLKLEVGRKVKSKRILKKYENFLPLLEQRCSWDMQIQVLSTEIEIAPDQENKQISDCNGQENKLSDEPQIQDPARQPQADKPVQSFDLKLHLFLQQTLTRMSKVGNNKADVNSHKNETKNHKKHNNTMGSQVNPNPIVNQKMVFQSLPDYFREVMRVRAIDLSLLESFSLLEKGKRECYDRILKPLAKTLNENNNPNGDGNNLLEGTRRDKRGVAVAKNQSEEQMVNKSEMSVSKVSEQFFQQSPLSVVSVPSKGKLNFVMSMIQALLQRIHEQNLFEIPLVKDHILKTSTFAAVPTSENAQFKGQEQSNLNQLQILFKMLTKCIIKVLQVSEGSISSLIQKLSFGSTERSSQYFLIVRTLLLEHLAASYTITKGKDQYHRAKYALIKKYIETGIENQGSISDQLYQTDRNFADEKWKNVLPQLLLIIRLYTLPHHRQENKVSKYFKFYESIYNVFTDKRLIDPSKLQTAIEITIQKAKISELSQESEETTLLCSFDRLLKSDLQVVDAIATIKNYIAQAQLQREKAKDDSNGPSMQRSQINFYLSSFSQIVTILFSKLQGASSFQSKFIANALKAMQIPMYVDQLLKKLTLASKQQRQAESKDIEIAVEKVVENSYTTAELQLMMETMFNLLRVFLLAESDPETSGLCLRIIFFLLEAILKQERQQLFRTETSSASAQLSKMIIFLNSLVRTPELRKKFDTRVLFKNIQWIYWYSGSNPTTEAWILPKIYSICSQAFHNKHYKPKKAQDAIGYFLMISKEYAAEFQKGEVEFDQKMRRVFLDCYNIFKQHSEEVINFCSTFRQTIQDFNKMMNGELRDSRSEANLNDILRGQAICHCCQLDRDNMQQQTERQGCKVPKQIFFVIAKYLENKNKLQKVDILALSESEAQSIKQQLDTEDQYYNIYFLLCLRGAEATKGWKQMLRYQISKCYSYFDSLVGIHASTQPTGSINLNPLELYKQKFKFAKRLCSYVQKIFNEYHNFKSLVRYAQERICILNAIKINERRLNLKFSQLDVQAPLLCKDKLNHHNKLPSQSKYMQGIITLLTKSKEEDYHLIEVDYINLVEYRLPLMHFQACRGQITGEEYGLQKVLIKAGQLLLTIVEHTKQAKANEIQENNLQRRAGGNNVAEKNNQIQHLIPQIFIDLYSCCANLIITALRQIYGLDQTGLIGNNDSFEMLSFLVHSIKQFSLSLICHHELQEWGIYDILQNTTEQINTSMADVEIIEIDDRMDEEGGQRDEENGAQMIDLIQDENESQNGRQKEKEKENEREKDQQKKKQGEPSKKIILPKISQVESQRAIIASVESVLQKISQLFIKFLQKTNGRSKKEAYYRFNFMANLSLSKIHHAFGDQNYALSCLASLNSVKTEELVHFYHHYENQSTEKNLTLTEFYSRSIVYHLTKIDAIDHLIVLFSRHEHLQSLIMLIRKLMKMSIHKFTPTPVMQPGQQKSEVNLEQDPKKPKDEVPLKVGKGKPKKIKTKQKGTANKVQRSLKWLKLMALKGMEMYLYAILIQRESNPQQQLDDKFERALPQFKNKLKKQADRQKKQGETPLTYTADLLKKYEQQLQAYEQKFHKQIKLKLKKTVQEEKPSAKNDDKMEEELQGSAFGVLNIEEDDGEEEM